MKVQIIQSTRKDKKMMAIFYDDVKVKTTHFGAKGYSDYTMHQDEKRKEKYINRHKPNENWNDYQSAGCLSRYILWNKITLEQSINDYVKRFNLKKLR